MSLNKNRSNAMPNYIQEYAKKNNLTVAQVEQLYKVEKDLAQKLRNSTKAERKYLYSHVYDELFQKIPFHPQLINTDPEANLQWSHSRMRLIREFLPPEATFLEVGSGDCCLALEVAKLVRKVYAVDVSNEITKNISFPPNMELVISDGVNIPVSNSSIDVVYSDQLMEHLHPEDAIEQLQNIYKALNPGGVYICHTPNRLSGPHDISGCYDETATGFHLQEYLITDLYNLFKKVGFSQMSYYKSTEKFQIKIPLTPTMMKIIELSEHTLLKIPYSLRRKIARSSIIFRGISLVAVKPIT
jgi:SAM-dependent methyltransferase